jgi:hypothetical protein
LEQEARNNETQRAKNLYNYAKAAAAIARGMKQADPNVYVYITGDWVRPGEFTRIRNAFLANGGDWNQVNGVDLHIYSGDNGNPEDYRRIQARLTDIRRRTGKSKIFASEWAPSRQYSNDFKWGLCSANNMVIIMHKMIRAGVTAASYWPPVDYRPGLDDQPWGIGMIDRVNGYRDLPHGQAFTWMASELGRYAVNTAGTVETVASHDPEKNTITVLVPTKESSGPITVHFVDKTITRVVRAHVMWMPHPRQRSTPANIKGIPAFISSNNKAVTVTANPGTSGLRGSSCELIKFVVHYR